LKSRSPGEPGLNRTARNRPDGGGMSGAQGRLMIIEVTYFDSQEFDDSHFFQRLTLIDICCGPPAIN
jgi:hypothetical protein